MNERLHSEPSWSEQWRWSCSLPKTRRAQWWSHMNCANKEVKALVFKLVEWIDSSAAKMTDEVKSMSFDDSKVRSSQSFQSRTIVSNKVQSSVLFLGVLATKWDVTVTPSPFMVNWQCMQCKRHSTWWRNIEPWSLQWILGCWFWAGQAHLSCCIQSWCGFQLRVGE